MTQAEVNFVHEALLNKVSQLVNEIVDNNNAKVNATKETKTTKKESN